MPFPVDVDATWLNPAAVQLDAGELRRADAAMLAGAGGFAFGGIARHSDTSLAVTIDGSDNVTIQPGSAILPGNAATGVGVYRAGLAAAVTNPLPTARNATNPRVDLVVIRAMDTDVVGSHGAYTGRIEVITGTPSATPVGPPQPSMSVVLGHINVPASGGGAASVDPTYRTYACAAGGELLVPTSARFPAGAPKWQKGRALDTGTEWIHNGSAWSPATQHFTGNLTTNAAGYTDWTFPTAFASQLLGYTITDLSDPAGLGALTFKVATQWTSRSNLSFRVYASATSEPLVSTTVALAITAWGR